MGGSALRMLGFLVIGGGLLYGLNTVSGNNHSADYYDRLAAIPKLEALALCLCIAAFFAFFGRKRLDANERLGVAIPVIILGVTGQALAPTAAYFITLSLLLCGLGSFLIYRWPDRKFGAVAAVIMTAMVAGYMLSIGHLLMLGVGPNMLPVAILPAAIAALAILPLYQGLPKRACKILAITGLAVSILIALWIRLDPIAATVPLY